MVLLAQSDRFRLAGLWPPAQPQMAGWALGVAVLCQQLADRPAERQFRPPGDPIGRQHGVLRRGGDGSGSSGPARPWARAEVCATGQSRYLLSLMGAWPHALTPTAP